MAAKIILDGRTDIENYFKLSGVFDAERLNPQEEIRGQNDLSGKSF